MDISIKSLEIENNGTEWKSPSGLLKLTWKFMRANLPQSGISWTMPFDDVTDNFKPDISRLDWDERLAFRQDVDSTSILIAEFITTEDRGLMAKLVNSILGFGFTTVSGMITKPLIASIFDTSVSDIKIEEKHLLNVGYGKLEIEPTSRGDKTIVLKVPSTIEIVRAVSQTIPSHVVDGKYLEKSAKNGKLVINLT